MLIDAQQRQQATSPSQSFIVQAPAGSGKTEILTQRYLRLLNHVNSPEQIIALTFTRKAAYEMRARILAALREVADGIIATSPHQATTHAYAQDALKRSQLLDWQLLQQPSRLRIMTIDALCQTLTNAIHLHESLAHNVSDKPKSLYLDASRSCIEYLQVDPNYHETLKILLRHLDNRQDQLLYLFCQLISNRDQWLPLIYQARSHTQDDFEHALDLIINHELARFKNCLPNELAITLVHLAKRVAHIEQNPNSLRYALQNLQSINLLDRDLAAGLAALVLTTNNTVRKSFDHHVGLRKGSCSDQEYAHLKLASKELLQKLTELPDFVDALLRIKQLPKPEYDVNQWQVLQALLTVLPLLIAHLQITFKKHNKVDFSAISQNAVHALGDDQDPTDLALYLDHQIQHLLIDEFQDTSLQQFQLLTSLVRGWEQNDGRTLFVVGDPMQSIYRFRAAEVGLFLRAREQGIGTIKLTPLELRCNFRSTELMINWINHQFKNIFPKADDLESGAISYLTASNPGHATSTDSEIIGYKCGSKEQEAQEIICKVMDELSEHPEDNIAILVRSRHQLTSIITLLKQYDIPFQGVDIVSLAHLPHIKDVFALTQALLLPADRLNWLTFLRSPWCGLSLQDLQIIANVDRKKSIYYALSQAHLLENLSDEGKTRASWLYQIFHNALAQRNQCVLVDWILQTLKTLHLDKILSNEQQNDLEQYWKLLEQFDRAGQIEDLNLFKQELNQLYSKKVISSRLQIMTIHKSKGLEFDTVILPGLGSKSPIVDQPLLRWLHLPSHDHGELLLISPIKASGETHDPLYQYLAKIDMEKDHYEQQRLLYVAATRAKKRLYLFDHNTNVREGTFRALLKNQDFTDLSELNDVEINPTSVAPILYHLPLHYYQATPMINHLDKGFASKLSINLDNSQKWFGIIMHELLQWICTYHPNNINDIPWSLTTHKMQSLGIDAENQILLINLAKKQILNMFNCPIGKWIIKPHLAERNEYEWLTNEEDGDVITRIIDRTFIENDTRWIIDFKTGAQTPESQLKHQTQVNQYAQLFSQTTSLKICCGLYYLDSGNWVDWIYSKKH